MRTLKANFEWVRERKEKGLIRCTIEKKNREKLN